MVIISEQIDIFSNRVENWLKSSKEEYHRINTENAIKFVFLELNNKDCDIVIRQHNISSEIHISKHKVWHRRGFLSFGLPVKIEGLNDKFKNFLNDEAKSLSDGILMILYAKGLLIGNHIEEKDNKLYHLFVASMNGLNIPQTFIVNSKDKLKNIYENNKSIITKPISNSFFGKLNGKSLVGFVEKFDESYFNILPDTFFPMLFQEDIERKYEIRTFYFCEEIFSMATIVTENNNEAKDIKEINENIKRYIPYKLETEVEKKIILMMKQIRLDVAAIDFVMSKNNVLYFLELNQFGQLNEMSQYCNYNIEEMVAKKIISNE